MYKILVVTCGIPSLRLRRARSLMLKTPNQNAQIKMPMLVTDNLRQSACYPGVLPLKRFEGELRTTAPPLLVLPSPLLFQLLFG